MTEEKNEENQEDAVVPLAAPLKSHGALLGALLFGFLVLVILVILAGIACGGYRGWNMKVERAALPSIATLAQTNSTLKEDPSPQAAIEAITAPVDTATSPESIKNAQATVIKVLNGGAAKGSAGTATTFLTKEGYAQVTLGNTLGNYTGTTVYFAVGMEKVAETVKMTLLKSYPKTDVKPALPSNQETTQAPITVILGQ